MENCKERVVTKIVSGVISFRAECQNDVDVILKFAKNYLSNIKVDVRPDPKIPDVVVEMTFDETDRWYDWMYTVARSIPDSHVMVESVRPVPLNENELDRVSGNFTEDIYRH